MKVLTISGSTRPDSTNLKFLKTLPNTFKQFNFIHFDIGNLPMFHPHLDVNPLNDLVLKLRSLVATSEAIIISTPEYLHNMPAVLKNALEWLASSGEMYEKKVFPMTLMLIEPRGEKAMTSLLASLIALDANIQTSLALYKDDFETSQNGELRFKTKTIGVLETLFEMSF